MVTGWRGWHDPVTRFARVRDDACAVVARGAVTRELAIGAAGLGALGLVGFADATIADDVDFHGGLSRHRRERAFRAPFAIGETNVHLRPSVGCAIAPTDGNDSALLLRVADERMYRDKLAGSTRLPGAAPTMEHLYLDG